MTTENDFNITSSESPQHFLIFGALNIPVSVVGTVGSVVTLYLIVRQNSLQRSSTSNLMVNLCVATFLLCGTSSFYDAYTMITGSPGPGGVQGPLCVAFAFLHFLWLSVSAHSHAAIAIHRLIAVVKVDQKNFGQNITSKILAAILISYTWVVPFFVLVFPLGSIGGTYGFNLVASRCSIVQVSSAFYRALLKVMNSFVPLGIMVFCYTAIFVKIIKSRQRFNLEESAIRGQGARGQRLLRFKAEIRVTYIAFLTCAWFIICYIPSSAYTLTTNDPSGLTTTLAQALILVTWIGCATTPILYTLLSTDMRSLAKKEWLLLRRHSNSVHVHIVAFPDDAHHMQPDESSPHVPVRSPSFMTSAGMTGNCQVDGRLHHAPQQILAPGASLAALQRPLRGVLKLN